MVLIRHITDLVSNHPPCASIQPVSVREFESECGPYLARKPGSQSVQVHSLWVLHFDPRRLGLRSGLSIGEPAMRAGKLVSRLCLADLSSATERSRLAVTTYVRD